MAGPSVEIKEDIFKSLAATHRSNDQVVLKRMVAILEICSLEGHTVHELAEEFGVHYRTVYNDMRALREYGLLEPEMGRRNKQMVFCTNWALVKQQESELRVKRDDGQYVPLSVALGRIYFVLPEQGEIFRQFTRFAVAIREDKKLEAQAKPSHGEEFRLFCLNEMAGITMSLQSLVNVMNQVMASPVFTLPEGWEMMKLPVGEVEDDGETKKVQVDGHAAHTQAYLAFIGEEREVD